MSSIEIQVNQIGKKLDYDIQPEQVKSNTNSNSSNTNGANKKVGITTLGCKVNTYESELISQMLQTKNWQPVKDSEKADLYLINTCTVTREADRQARQAVRKAIKRNPDALLVVTGCYAQIEPEVCAQIPGVDLVLGNDRKLDIHQLLPKLERGELPKVLVGDLDQHISLPEHLLGSYEAHTRAFVQIQQGCDQGCTFCIIHVARGPSRSLAPSLVKRQVQRLALNGYPEIVICGVDLGAYGADLTQADESFDLVDLLRELLELECDEKNPFRIRVSSIDPHHISDRFIQLMASEPRLCPHIHLSLQSGSDLILKRMKRRYSAAHMIDRINKLRSVRPELVLSADVMVGFPTESEEDFLETKRVVKVLEVAFPHTFSYSERRGTPAARIPSVKQVPVPMRKQRNKHLRELGQSIREKLMTQRIGKTAYVLPEKKSKWTGFTHCRAEDYLEVLVPSDKVSKGVWQQIRYQSIHNGLLLAEVE